MLQFLIMEPKSINNYKCPACGGGLNFDPTSGKIICEYCDSSYTVEQIEEIYKPAEASSEEAHDDPPEVSGEGFDSAETNWDTDSLNSDWGEDTGNMKEYNCPSCGAVLICETTTAATSCPYCGNPTIIEQQFSGSLHPDYCIPFKLKKQDAIDKLKEFYKKKFLLPKLFSDENHLEEIKGIYVPFWLFDGTAEGTLTFRTTTKTSVKHGNSITTTTRYYDCIRSGKIDFSKIPADASEKMPDDMMDSLEPFDYSKMIDFEPGYLSGHMAERFDEDADHNIERVKRRMWTSADTVLRQSVTGYSSVKKTGGSLQQFDRDVRYALFPVYVFNIGYQGKDYHYAVNGQTGKIVGELPFSKALYWKWKLIRTGLIFAAVYVISFFLH